MAPTAARYVAVADQDDSCHPDKLETRLAELHGAELIYSDARLVRREGELIADTYWSVRAKPLELPVTAGANS